MWWLCGGHRPCDALNSAASNADQPGRLEHSCADVQILSDGPFDLRTNRGPTNRLAALSGRSRFDSCHIDAGLARTTLQYNLLPVIVDRKAIVRAEEFRVSSRRGPPTDEYGHQRRMEFSAALSAPS